MTELETIRVENKKSKSGFMLINKSDFDPKVHCEFGKLKPAKKPAKLTLRKRTK